MKNSKVTGYYFEVHICVTPVKILQVHLGKQSFISQFSPVFDVMQQFIAYVLNINNERMPIANVTLSLSKRLCNLQQGRSND
jgi:hypothetical protein